MELLRRTTPAPGPGEVLLELCYAGICHTDVNMISGAYGPGSGYAPNYPVVLGHEFTARVVDVGSGVDDLSQGTRVVSGCHLTCGLCRWCAEGRSMLCVERRVIGLDADGCWAERFIAPRRNLVALPNSVSDTLAALAEPFAVGAHAVDLSGVTMGERVAIIGPGTVGLLTLGALAGHDVSVIGRRADAPQLDHARDFGAKEVIISGDLSDDMEPFDVIFETAGNAAAASLGAARLAPGGRLVCVGLPAQSAHIDTAQLAWQEQAIIGSRAYDISTWQTIPQRLANAPQLEAIVSHKLHFEELNRALQLIETREATKVLLHP
ncbi:zinc-dependent alcohol dehydrogenase [Paramicrobacterium chengjingii]|uniref:zinc-dependent alcohol dehydrogenase n=1 Tax=Paramicrobacterium chengjingii TaxID=2769067 RepID=UPI001422AC19|nr:alcohol dehydrogenase catalytic domain-containing protein [Microbacterium chengjingii]